MAGKSQGKSLSDLFLAIGVVIVIMMIIIPLPTGLLDLFMALNLLLSVLVLLLVLFTPRAIEFSSFPTVLLVETVFGLGLNVSSTRLILSKGTQFDGKMVRAFSTFVIGTDGTDGLLIGFVIFIIIIAVQAFVITKGATRVSEVAARFTLDAMPMKQTAVEQEYNSGRISEEEYQKRKNEVQLEANFYGSMDGATKFVSGNVKIGIFITVINLVVGLIFGMVLRDEDFSTAIQTYAALTIGDGLLSQVPSLLISFATGLIVTRAASDGEKTLGQDIKKEFSQSATIYYVAGGTMAAMGILPGFPWYFLIPIGGALLFLGFRLGNIKQKAAAAGEQKGKAKQGSASGQGAQVTSIAPLDPLSLELGLGLLNLVDKEKGAELLERILRMRHEAGIELGLVVPSIHVIDNVRLDPSEYCFKLKGVEIGKSKLRMGSYMCLNTGGVTQELNGEPTKDPAFGLSAIWLPENRREEAERAGYSVIDPPTIIATHLTELIKRYSADILGYQETQMILDSLKKTSPAIVEDSLKAFKLGEIQKVLQGLLREQVSIRNMVVILETMLDYETVTHKTEILVEKVRQALGRQICFQYADQDASGKSVLHVITVDNGFLAELIQSRVDKMDGPITTLPVNRQNAWIQSLASTMKLVQENGYLPIIFCPEEARLLVKKSTERNFPNLVVISIQEITNDINVEIVGEVTVNE